MAAAAKAKKSAPAPAANPLTKSTYAEAMTSRWALADALMGGSEAMRDMGEELLPQHNNESDDDYANRLTRSFLLPVFSQTVEQLADIVFSDHMTMAEKLPEDLKTFLKAVDAEGRDIEAFAKNVLQSALAKSEVYIIADEPPLAPAEDGKVVTLKDRKAQGVKPYLAVIAADNMLAFEVETRDGQQACTYARWSEMETRQADDFTEETVTRVVEWRPGEWRKHEKAEGDESWVTTKGVLNFKRDGKPALPIVRYRLGKVDSMGRLQGPLQGLAEKNVEHWQSASDQRAILTVSRFPMLGGSGVDPNNLEDDGGDIEVGPNCTLFTRDPQGKFYYVETNGAAISAGKDDIENILKDMSQLAYQPLMRQAAGVTATKDALAESKSNSSLAAWALDLGGILDRAVALISLWKGQTPPETKFKPNTEFGIETIDQTRVTALTAMRAAGDISRPQYIGELQRARVLSEEFDAEANEAELESEGPEIPEPLPLDDPNNPPDPNAPPGPSRRQPPKQPKPPVAA